MGKFLAPAAAAASALLVIGAPCANAGSGAFGKASASGMFISGETTGGLFNLLLDAVLPNFRGMHSFVVAGPVAADTEPTTAKGECSNPEGVEGEPVEGDENEKDQKTATGPEPIYFGF